MTKHILLYDHERDKGLKEGQVLLVFEDGTTKKVREARIGTGETSLVGAIHDGAAGSKQEATRLPKTKQRLSLRPARTKGKSLSGG